MRAFSLLVSCIPVQCSTVAVEHSFLLENTFHIFPAGESRESRWVAVVTLPSWAQLVRQNFAKSCLGLAVHKAPTSHYISPRTLPTVPTLDTAAETMYFGKNTRKANTFGPAKCFLIVFTRFVITELLMMIIDCLHNLLHILSFSFKTLPLYELSLLKLTKYNRHLYKIKSSTQN